MKILLIYEIVKIIRNYHTRALSCPGCEVLQGTDPSAAPGDDRLNVSAAPGMTLGGLCG